MAGGIGSRFWPVSTTELPKQFHDMLGTGETLIQKTFNRLSKVIPEENICILTHERYKDLVLEQLPKANPGQLLLEPEMRNTAPCILYASMKIRKENPDAVILVAPSDHWIEQEDIFVGDVKRCFAECAERDILMTLGITPTFPNTGYGYIEYDAESGNNGHDVCKVKKFTEKPDYATAKEFLRQGNYLWNAGIFIWSVKSILKAFEHYSPKCTVCSLRGYRNTIPWQKERLSGKTTVRPIIFPSTTRFWSTLIIFMYCRPALIGMTSVPGVRSMISYPRTIAVMPW